MRTEDVPDKKRCEMCGALIVNGETDLHERPQTEFLRRLAFIADEAPDLALLLLHHICGTSKAGIARKIKTSEATVRRKIKIAQKILAGVK